MADPVSVQGHGGNFVRSQWTVSANAEVTAAIEAKARLYGQRPENCLAEAIADAFGVDWEATDG